METHMCQHFVELIQEMVNNGAHAGAAVGQIRQKEEEDKEDPRVAQAKLQHCKDYAWDFDQESTDEDELTEEDKKIRTKRKKIKKKVEVDEKSKYNHHGKKNAWHFVADMKSIYFSEKIFNLLFSLGIDVEAKDLYEVGDKSPIMLQIEKGTPQLIKKNRSDFFD